MVSGYRLKTTKLYFQKTNQKALLFRNKKEEVKRVVYQTPQPMFDIV